MTTPISGARHAPAAERNRGPILEVLRRVLPERGLVLEIASGTGQHSAFFAAELPHLDLQPSDRNRATLDSIEAHRQVAAVPNLRAPVALDVTTFPWPVQEADAVICINMIHIAPFAACEALFDGAAATLPEGGVLFLYGPFKRGGAHTAASNEAFDRGLKARDSSWGVRDLGDVERVAQRAGFGLPEVVTMPANNLSVVFLKRHLAPGANQAGAPTATS